MVAVVLFCEHFTLKLNNFTSFWNFAYILYRRKSAKMDGRLTEKRLKSSNMFVY